MLYFIKKLKAVTASLAIGHSFKNGISVFRMSSPRSYMYAFSYASLFRSLPRTYMYY